MLVLSLLFLTPTLPMLFLSGGKDILIQGLKLAGSTFNVGDLDQAALGFLNMSMLKPLWEEIWIGIFGVYCAISLKQGKPYAWPLSLFWGIMLITNGVIQGAFELLILGWSYACMQTYLYLGLGIIAVISMILARK